MMWMSPVSLRWRHEAMPSLRLRLWLILSVACAVAGPAPAGAQTPADSASSSYQRRALRIEPGFWAGRLVRGTRGEQVTHVLPWTDLTAIVAGVDSAVVHAARFETKQRWGGGLYLLGTMVAVVPLVRNRGWNNMGDTDMVIFISGEIVALFGSMIVQSSRADLSRAVWWYNSQFARE